MKTKNNWVVFALYEFGLVVLSLGVTGVIIYILLFVSKTVTSFIGYYLFFVLLITVLFKGRNIWQYMQKYLRMENVKTREIDQKDDPFSGSKAKAVRRYFSIEYKRRIVEKYDSGTEEEQRALLKRENISRGYLSRWREKIIKIDNELALLQQDDKQQGFDPKTPLSENSILKNTEIVTKKHREPHDRVDEDISESEEKRKQRVCPACNVVVSPTNDSCANCGTYLGVEENASRTEDEITSDNA